MKVFAWIRSLQLYIMTSSRYYKGGKKVKILVPIAENKYGLRLTMKSEKNAELINE